MRVCAAASHILTFGANHRVLGVTSVNNKLFVLLDRHQNQVEVYSMKDYKSLNDRLSLPSGLTNMTSCERYKCLYVCSYDRSFVCKYDLYRSIQGRTWPVRGKPCGLSVTPSCNILVTCREPNRLVELKAIDGQVVREIALQSDIAYPEHSVQPATGQYVVCHGAWGSGLHRVCVVGDNGKVTGSYGGQYGCGRDVGQLNGPRHLFVNTDPELIFVADENNIRVVLLSSTLEFVRYVDAVARPLRVYFDKATRRLFIGQYWASGGGVSVIQL